ncbi:Ig-like domain-containing protein [Tautonia plasticadhaerens]|uniref:Ig-like domain-containing protein n=1 Tax=Tautonia plasticadhaerens TaxID=2527974 RepID=UPI0011A84640|nr:Ig-like domain-containing protein [Tautonia plasticadhaerens]
MSSGPPTGTWVGQDRHDLVGRSSTPAPNGIQDVRLALSDLPPGLPVTAAEVRGHGGGIWSYNGDGTHWTAAFAQVPGSTNADVFFDPYKVEVGRPFSVRLWFEDGSTSLVSLAGGVADPTFRMPEAVAQPSWVGQDGSDRVGPGTSVGPDGVQDAVIALANLTAGVEIDGIDVRGPGPLAWQSGTNADGLPNAELIRDATDPSLGRLYVQPGVDLDGLPLSLTISYADGTLDLVELLGGPTEPGLAVPPPASVPTRPEAVTGRWAGQSDDPVAGLGAASVELAGLPAGRAVVAASLSGSDRGVTWAFSTPAGSSIGVEPNARALAFRRDPGDPTRASIAFPPEKDETGTTMTLRLSYDDGSISIVRLDGGAADPSRRAARPSPSSVVARPGDDLQALADSYGSIRLAAGEYRLDRPLALNRPITITADPGATLRFSQPDSATPWGSAILVHRGNTTLDGFAVRFDGPVRWDWTVPYDPAVIASTDTRTPTLGSVKVGIVLSNLDLEGPPASSTSGPWERSAALVNLASAEDGRILGNALRGGTVRVIGGPWEISGNTYRGAMPGTWAYDVFAMTNAHDVDVLDNVASPLPGSGKTYRFLVMTQNGSEIRVERNRVEGIGPRDDDAQPHPNAPEVILTEAYRVNFEGMPSGLSADGSILQIPPPQGEVIRSGDVVAVLSGPMAGQWRRVAQVIDQRTLVLDTPLPTDRPIGVVSVSGAFVGLDIRDNSVDVRGSSVASPLVLAGAHFDAEVSGNRLLGGADVRLASSASERTVHWGWTHTPMFGVRFASNTIEDSLTGLDAGLARYPWAKSSRGRTYFDAEIADNLFSWSPDFFKRTGKTAAPAAMRVGDALSIDPLESRVVTSGNAIKVPPGIGLGGGIDATNAILNGVSIASQGVPLPAQPLPPIEGLRLVADTGSSQGDGLTRDPRLTFASPSWASSLEYRLVGQPSHRPVSSEDVFMPQGVSDGVVTVLVRGIDDFGRPGPEGSITFRLDTTAPPAVTPRLGPGQDTGISDSDRLTRITSPTFVADGDATDTLILLLDGREQDRRVGPGTLRVGGPLADGAHRFSIRRIDAAGNATPDAPTAFTIDATPPPAASVSLAPGQDTGISPTDNLTRLVDPLFRAVIDSGDVLALLRDGVEVDRRSGTGSLRAGGPLADGTYRFSVRRIDAAGNATDGPGRPVTIDATAPGPVSGLSHLGAGRLSFSPMAGAADYVYQVDGGPSIPLAGATTFRPRGLPFESTSVAVRAIDAAGNLGAEAIIRAAMPTPVGTWIGQRPGVDLVGRRSDVAQADGFQDIGIALTGLPTDRSITSAEVRGWGGGIWQHNIAGPYWRASLVQAPRSDRAEVYFQPHQLDPGRSYFVRLRFSDGTTVGITLQGGAVDPSLPTSPAPTTILGDSSAGIGATSDDGLAPEALTPGAIESGGGTPTPTVVDPPASHSGPVPAPETPQARIDPSHRAALRPRPTTWQERLAMVRAINRERHLARRRAMEEIREAYRGRLASLGLIDGLPRPTRRWAGRS